MPHQEPCTCYWERRDAWHLGGLHSRFGAVRVSGVCVSGSYAFSARLRFRPVRPVRSAWHEMPGHGSARVRRPARAVLSRKPPCDGSYAWRGDGGLGLPRTAFPRRCGCEPVRVDRMQGRAALRCEAKSWPYRPQSQGWRRVCRKFGSQARAGHGFFSENSGRPRTPHLRQPGRQPLQVLGRAATQIAARNCDSMSPPHRENQGSAVRRFHT